MPIDELQRGEIEAALREEVETFDDGWCTYLDAELEDGWAAEGFFQCRLEALHAIGPFAIARVEAEFWMTHPTEDYTGRTIALELAAILVRSDSTWSVLGAGGDGDTTLEPIPPSARPKVPITFTDEPLRPSDNQAESEDPDRPSDPHADSRR